ncbi:hypothetical protein ADIS_1557 [Lunatimonas lonarensis]|uniref:DUF4199 domain-containing protein n=1 Tax=Lunatimonas lonarensis TaxID=1232681 RepID=R7ZVG0_9BACT|nr:DUF4199 domain-containing protein [Lunatimonas lonarensis]EON78018.1 hypothetical protein ADIS_1557 [Lunatimonas lonarensis]
MNRYLSASLPFGLAGGILLAVGFTLLYALGAEPVGMVLIFGYVIVPLFVFAGIKQFRDKHNGGELFFSQGMSVGFFVYTLMALISATFIGLFIVMQPEVFEVFKASNIALLETKRELLIGQLGEKSYEDTFSSIQAMSLSDVVINDFLRKIIPGLFFTIIISIILKRTFIS